MGPGLEVEKDPSHADRWWDRPGWATVEVVNQQLSSPHSGCSDMAPLSPCAREGT